MLQEEQEDCSMDLHRGEKPIMLVTGISGLIGTRIIDAFSGDYRTVGLDVKRPETQTAEVDWIKCDLTEDASTRQALAEVREKHGERLASVIHLAAYYDFSGKPSPLYQTLTVEGTRRLLRELRKFQAEQFVFSSSLLVMKPAEAGEIITEASPTEAEWDYPGSKLEAEKAIEQERGAIPSVILRIAGVYDEDCHSIPIAQHIRRIYEKQFESYFFPGDPEHGQPFVHLDDLIDCLRRVVERRHTLGQRELLLIAEPEVVSYGDLQERLGELIHGEEWPTIRIPKTVAKAGAWAKEKLAGDEGTFIKPWMVDVADAHYPVTIERARQRLDWAPKHHLRRTLDEMIRRLKRDPRQWYRSNRLPWPGDGGEDA
jgi:nucleoside-diphosphate-sugar epimerase